MPLGITNTAGTKNVVEFTNQIGAGFHIELARLQTADSQIEVSERYMRRTDTGALLALVGGGKRTNYAVLQNSTAFAPFQKWVDAGLVDIESGGSVLGGRANWISGKVVGNDGEVTAGDPLKNYFTIFNPHDGKRAIYAMFSNYRMQCNNQLMGMSRNEATKKLRIRHSAGIEMNFGRMMEIADIARQEFAANLEQYRFLAGRKVNQADVEKYVKKLWEVTENEEIGTRSKNILDMVYESIESGLGQNVVSSRGSYFWLWQGVNGYINHKDGRNAENRINNMMFGPNADFDQKAYGLALEMANAA